MTTTTRPLTAEDLRALPDDGCRHELIEGELTSMAPAGEIHALTAGRIAMLAPRELIEFGDFLIAEPGFVVSREPWVAWPEQRSVWAWRSSTDVRILQKDDELDGGDVLPGFRSIVKESFPS